MEEKAKFITGSKVLASEPTQ